MMFLSSNPPPKRLHDLYTMYIESTAIVKRQNDSASDALDFTSGSAGIEFQFFTFSISSVVLYLDLVIRSASSWLIKASTVKI